MKKQDYATLADIFRARISARLAMPKNEQNALIIRELSAAARDFAARASVDKTAFLTACGI